MAATLNVDSDERTQLEQLARNVKDVRIAIRIRAILALSDGYGVAEVARLFLLDEDTVSKWRNKFKKRRLLADWLTTNRHGYAGRLSPEQEQAIDQFVCSEMVTNVKQVVGFIREQFAVTYTLNGATKLLHRLGFTYKQTTLIPGKLDEAAQAEFKRAYEKLRDNLPDDELILFGDGVHPQHNTHAVRAWIKQGEQKQVPSNTGRKRLNITGVLELEKMRTVVHYAETLNAAATMELFEMIQAAYPDKKKIHLIVDNARYYKNKDLQAYLRKRQCRIRIRWLPAYSPNLNFIERLWHYLKQYVIGTKRRDKFKDFEADIRYFFDHIDDYEDKLRQFIGTEMHLIRAV